jgi:hypothetical protein
MNTSEKQREQKALRKIDFRKGCFTAQTWALSLTKLLCRGREATESLNRPPLRVSLFTISGIEKKDNSVK